MSKYLNIFLQFLFFLNSLQKKKIGRGMTNMFLDSNFSRNILLNISYCDQPFVSETTRCVSDDFIKTIDDSGQNVVHFYV
jgi:hypothetical protein